MPANFRGEGLARAHDVSGFTCGAEALDRYLRQVAGQDVKRDATRVFVLVDNASGSVAGFYTLSMASIELSDLDEDLRRKLPRYPMVPAVLIGRLARDIRYRGRGCGELLLVDALQRISRVTREVAAFAVIVDAKDESAAAFYRRYGFMPLQDRADRLLLPVRAIAGLGGEPRSAP